MPLPEGRRPACRPLSTQVLWAAGALAALHSGVLHARTLVFGNVVISAPADADMAQSSALRMFTQESMARTGQPLPWPVIFGAAPVHEREGRGGKPGGRDPELRIVAARQDQLPALVSQDLRKRLASCSALDQSEGFSISVLVDHTRDWVIVRGHDDRDMLYGLGYLLRKTQWSRGRGTLDHLRAVCIAPALGVRGHQLGYRAKSNTYDGWTVGQFEQYLRDLIVFGTNTIELLPPRTDDAPTSPLFPQPALETMVAVSGLIRQYGLRCSVFYPAMARDYRDPLTVRSELDAWEDVLRRLPQVDELFVPGGDPGHTEPEALFAFLEQLAPRLHRYHSQASIWVSAQGFNARQMEVFYELLAHPPSWLGGVVFGPQSRDPIEAQRERIPRGVPIRLYPDITHTHHAQFPVPHWDPALALTEGREPINPQPRAQTLIFHHFEPHIQGFVTYSEGVNDDVNKIVWSALGVDPKADPAVTLADYTRWFTGSELGVTGGERLAAAIAALERNWDGPLIANQSIGSTLRRFQQIESRASSAAQHNWRLQLALYRAWLDGLQRRRAREQIRHERLAMRSLARADRIGSEAALSGAERTLTAQPDAAIAAMQTRVQSLAAALFESIHLQLSVARYGASAVSRGANLDTINVSLNDEGWLRHQFAAIRRIPEESQRLAAIRSVLRYERPQPGSFYDDLGEPGHEPHLVLEKSFARDPDLRHTAQDGIADATPDEGWRRSWVTYAGALYDEPLTLEYDGLNPRTRYRLRVTYAGEEYTLPIRLVANDRVEIHAPRQRRANPETLEFDIPPATTATGHLTLRWTRPEGEGGSGRGCQVAEVWLLPVPSAQAEH